MYENPSTAWLNQRLLKWYDQNARDLPWRISPTARKAGQCPDPYSVWLSEIMLQQTTVAAVKGYFDRFITRWPSVADLANADDAAVMAAWAGLGYYARARNLLKCARIVTGEFDGNFPRDIAQLLNLPGIGPYTAAAIAAIAFDDPDAVVVDGNVERVMTRLRLIQTPLPSAKPEIHTQAAHLTPKKRAGDYAQALMDLGATVCTPKSPDCAACPWQTACAAYHADCATDLPRKFPKAKKPIRYATAYIVLRSDGAVLVEQRPKHGLLGGMLAFPATEFSQTHPTDAAPIDGDWVTLNTTVQHIFTHFKLLLRVQICRVTSARPNRGYFVARDQFDERALPNLMAKAWRIAKPAIDAGFEGTA